MIRELVKAAADTQRGRGALALMEHGSLVPDEWVNQMVAERLKAPDCVSGFVLDGYPRTRPQAVALESMLSSNGTAMSVVNIAVGNEEIIRRTTGRRVCSLCGTIYNIFVKPPKAPNECDLDGAPLHIRSDDREEVIRERIQAYENQTLPVIDYYRETGQPIHEVDGMLAPDQITRQLMRILQPS